LLDDDACHSSTLVGRGRISVMELSCKMFGRSIRFLAKFDKLHDFIEVMLHSGFELLLSVSHAHLSCVVAFDFADCC